MCEFFGIPEYRCIAAEGLDAGLRPVPEILQEAMRQIDQVLETF